MIGKNNPLNIRTGKSVWLGQTGSTRGFVDFSEPKYCFRAAYILLFVTYPKKYRVKTLRQAISVYCPDGDGSNDSQAYYDFIRLKCPNVPYHLSQFQFLDKVFVLYAMQYIEGNVVFGSEEFSDLYNLMYDLKFNSLLLL